MALLLVMVGVAPLAALGQAPDKPGVGPPELPPLKLGPGALELLPPDEAEAEREKGLVPRYDLYGTGVPGEGTSGWRDVWLEEEELRAEDKVARELLADDGEAPGWEKPLMQWVVGLSCFLVLGVALLRMTRQRAGG
jgi:hypothetical protein